MSSNISSSKGSKVRFSRILRKFSEIYSIQHCFNCVALYVWANWHSSAQFFIVIRFARATSHISRIRLIKSWSATISILQMKSILSDRSSISGHESVYRKFMTGRSMLWFIGIVTFDNTLLWNEKFKVRSSFTTYYQTFIETNAKLMHDFIILYFSL